MKLYATTTSERASKGQGGNKFIRVEFLVGNATDNEYFGAVILKETDDKGYVLYHNDRIGESHIVDTMRVKGKSQKGEKWDCKICKRHHDSLIDCTDYHI